VADGAAAAVVAAGAAGRQPPHVTAGVASRSSAVRARLPQAAVTPRMKAAATWLFVLPLLTEAVLPDVVKLQVAGLAILAAAAIGSGRPLPRLAAERIFAVAAVLTLTVAGYLAFTSWPQAAGTPQAYDGRAVMWAVTFTLVAVVAVLFWDEDLFARVMWRACTVALWAGVITCAASRLTGHLFLVNPDAGALRMCAGMGEPAAWAPVLTVVLLLALRRRSLPYVLLALAGLVLADSPTCMLVMAVTVPLYFALTASWRGRLPLLAALLLIVPLAGVFVQRADVSAWLDSPDSAKIAVGRLVSGIRNVETGGAEGENSRYEDTSGVLLAARENGWLLTGAGPGADAVYFPAELAQGSATVAASNALWASVLFDFGAWGAAVLGVLVAGAAWRMRRRPVLCALLLPFCVSSMVSSSIPDWSFAALAVMLAALGWGLSPAQPASRAPDVDHGEPGRPGSGGRGRHLGGDVGVLVVAVMRAHVRGEPVRDAGEPGCRVVAEDGQELPALRGVRASQGQRLDRAGRPDRRDR
jgi:hypothetical protein